MSAIIQPTGGRSTVASRHKAANQRFKRWVMALCALPALWMAVRWFDGDRLGVPLGPRAVHREMHLAGIWTMRLLLLTLAVTPLRVITDWQRLVVIRRTLGVATALYALLHLLLYIVDRNFDFARVASELVHRRFLTLGALALLGLCALALTSTDGWLRRLGRRWTTLHHLVFPIVVLAALHFFMQKKFDVSDPVFYGGLLAWLLIWRLLPRRDAGGAGALALTGVLAVLSTWLIEYLWYEVATKVPGWRVLHSEFIPALAPRPGAWIALAALGICVFAWAVRRVVRVRRSR